MGLEQSVMTDKRTLRRLHKEKFQKVLNDWRSNILKVQTELDVSQGLRDSNTLDIELMNGSIAGKKEKSSSKSKLIVIARVRPILSYEKKIGDFRAVDCFADSRRLVVHHCCMHSDLIRLRVKHNSFLFDKVFGPKSTNNQVYSSIRPLIFHGFSGGMSTIFAYGQTGSGKTHTIKALCSRVVCDIFELVNKHKQLTKDSSVNFSVSLSSFELSGSKCRDLLLPTNNKLRLLEDETGCVNLRNISTLQPTDAKHFMSEIEAAFGNRATAETIHKFSSRSHAVLCITVTNACTFTEGKILLVDLAGSERNKDTVHHNSDRRAETIEILSSLLALKNCIRSMKQNFDRIPFRESKLTQILKASFTHESAKTAVIATVSPGSLDVEHTLTTLNSVSFDEENKKARKNSVKSIKGKQNIAETRIDTLKENYNRVDKQQTMRRKSMSVPHRNSQNKNTKSNYIERDVSKKNRRKKQGDTKSLATGKVSNSLTKGTKRKKRKSLKKNRSK